MSVLQEVHRLLALGLNSTRTTTLFITKILSAIIAESTNNSSLNLIAPIIQNIKKYSYYEYKPYSFVILCCIQI